MPELDFSQVVSMSIPEGEVVSIALNGQVIWEKPNTPTTQSLDDEESLPETE